jgi:hypothetical protein
LQRHRDHRPAAFDERQQDVEVAGALDELLGAVDRVGDPDPVHP